MKICAKWFVVAALAAFSVGSIAQVPVQAEPKLTVDAELSKLQMDSTGAMAKYMSDNKVVGMSVAIYRNGQKVYAKSLGFSNREQAKLANENTLYRYASVSKPIAATAAMMLWEKGKFSLDTDVRNYTTEWFPKPWPVTLRQVLSHTSGIRHYADGKQDNSSTHYNDAKLPLQKFAMDPLLFEPGTKYSYSTHAFTLLMRVIEMRVDKPYWVYMKSSFFPRISPTLDCENLLVPKGNRSMLYEKNATGVPVRETKWEDNSWKYAGGGMEGTASDLAKFGQMMLAGALVKPSTRDIMWTPKTLKDGSKTTYGLGFGVNGNIISHSGAQQGARSALRIDRGNNIVIAVLTNTGDNSPSDLAKILNDIWKPK